ncbi:MAG: CoA pyrophosphatase, partial [Bacteroidetes bacterium]
MKQVIDADKHVQPHEHIILDNLHSIAIEHIRNVLSEYNRKTFDGVKPPDVHEASVLVPLLNNNGEIHVLLTARTHDVETHKGQISFPGGMNDPEDANATATALRETEEEIGLPRASVEIIGAIDDFMTPSNFLITPIVGYISNLPPLDINKAEVAETLLVPLSFFADTGNGRTEQRLLYDKTVTVWFFEHQGHLIWGATAAMIKRLIEIIDNKE